jgi:predicted nucleic acid-binding protein
MIVVDTNVVAYLLIGGRKTELARLALKKDPIWVAPVLWRSEFRNVLAHYLRQGTLSSNNASRLMRMAELLFQGREYDVDSKGILELVKSSGCSAYDCEFVSLAKELEVPLITTDRQILREFPDIVVSLKSCGSKRE